jgi:hypothetical protein
MKLVEDSAVALRGRGSGRSSQRRQVPIVVGDFHHHPGPMGPVQACVSHGR